MLDVRVLQEIGQLLAVPARVKMRTWNGRNIVNGILDKLGSFGRGRENKNGHQSGKEGPQEPSYHESDP